MTISVRRLTDVLATTASGRLYRIEVFTQTERQDGPAPGDMSFRYVLRTSEESVSSHWTSGATGCIQARC